MNSKGYESLMEAVVRDCEDGNKCFNAEGCYQQFTTLVPATGDMLKYHETVCRTNTKCMHKYCDKFKWVVDRAKHYASALNLNWEDVLDAWEERRDYWYMNYYQASNQPEVFGDKVRVFDTVEEFKESIKGSKFRCPMCGGESTNPYVCNSGLLMDKVKICDWKSYGLFGDLGKGTFVYCKDKLVGETLFTPIAWEIKEEEGAD